MALLHYRELIAWQKAMDLVENVYRINYLDSEVLDNILQQTAEIGRSIHGLLRSLEQK